jgi:cadmium resistance protein CadD (predicted permease)
METLFALFGMAIVLFASTNVDDVFVLIGFFADPKFRARDIYSANTLESPPCSA